MTQHSLRYKTLHGVGWSAADTFIEQGVTFIVGLVLARILSPEEYGLIGICLIFTSILNGMVDSGFSNALIRKNDVTSEDLNTMFLSNIVMSIVLYLLLFLSAPWIATYFNRQELTALIRVIGSVLIINALPIVHNTVLIKRIDFKTKTKASLISALSSGIIGIGMAYSGYGVWALAAQALSKQFIYTASLWLFNHWVPDFSFRKDSFVYLWSFGSRLIISGLLDNIWKQLAQVVVGKFYSPETLGQYSRSREYSNIFSANITSIVQRVSYPALSEIQDDKTRLLTAYKKVIKVTMFVTCICLFFIGAVAEPLIYCLIGPKWHEAATYLPLICITTSLYPLHAINLNMLQIQGRSDIYLYLEIVKKVIGLIPVAMGIFINIYWMLIGSIIVGIISFFLNSHFSGKTISYTSWTQLKDVSASYGMALTVALSVYFIKFLPFTYWIILPLQILVGLSVCLTVCEMLQISEYQEIKKITSSVLHRLHF